MVEFFELALFTSLIFLTSLMINASLGLLSSTLEAYELLHKGVSRRWKGAKRLAIESGEDLDTALAGLDSPERLDGKLMAAIEKHILTVSHFQHDFFALSFLFRLCVR